MMSDPTAMNGSGQNNGQDGSGALAALWEAAHAAALQDALDSGDAELGTYAANRLADLSQLSGATMNLLARATEPADAALAGAAAAALAAHTPTLIDEISLTELAWLAGHGPDTTNQAGRVLTSEKAKRLLARTWADIHPPLRLLAAAATPDDELADATRQLLTTCHTGQCRRCRTTLSALTTTAAARDALLQAGTALRGWRPPLTVPLAGIAAHADEPAARYTVEGNPLQALIHEGDLVISGPDDTVGATLWASINYTRDAPTITSHTLTRRGTHAHVRIPLPADATAVHLDLPPSPIPGRNDPADEEDRKIGIEVGPADDETDAGRSSFDDWDLDLLFLLESQAPLRFRGPKTGDSRILTGRDEATGYRVAVTFTSQAWLVRLIGMAVAQRYVITLYWGGERQSSSGVAEKTTTDEAEVLLPTPAGALGEPRSVRIVSASSPADDV